jgi:hypothetical protein
MVIARSKQSVDQGEADRKGRVTALSKETSYIDDVEYFYTILLIPSITFLWEAPVETFR